MLQDTKDSIKDFYEGRHVLFTGASGMLGTAYLTRLLLDTCVTQIYAIVRGGERQVGNSAMLMDNT